MPTRREVLALLSAGGFSMALGEGARAAAAAGWPGYSAAMAIDGCGGLGNPAVDEPGAPLCAASVADVRASGLTAMHYTVGYRESLEETIDGISQAERELDLHPDVFLRVRNGADLRLAKASGRCGLIYAVQDLSMIGSDVGRIDLLHRLGLRVAQPTYNRRNLLGDGCLEPGNAGLSTLGHAAIARLDQLRIVLDLSHCGQRTTRETIAASKNPVAITHTGCAAIHQHPRNKRDEELRACAERGGVVGIYFMPYLRAAGQTSAEDVIRHLEHAIDVCGEDAVGLGTDLSPSPLVLTEKLKQAHRDDVQKRRAAGISAPGEAEDVFLYVPELNTARPFETLAALLLARRHSEARVEKLLGRNFARLFSTVWG